MSVVLPKPNRVPLVLKQKAAEFAASEAQRTGTEPPAAVPQSAPAAAPQSVTQPLPVPSADTVKMVPADEMTPPTEFAGLLDNIPAPPVQDLPTEDAAALQGDLANAQAKIATLQAELDAAKAKQADNQQQLDAYAQLKDEQELNDYIKNHSEFNSLDPEDAKHLLMPLFKSMKTERERTASELAQMRKDVENRFAKQQETEQAKRRQKTLDAVMKAHPDLQALSKSKAYAEVMTSPVGQGTNLLVGDLVSHELKRGNADYIIGVLNQIKAKMQIPSLDAVASVSGAATPAVSMPAADDDTSQWFTNDELAALNRKLVTGQISRPEYRKALSKRKEAVSRLQ